jgi:hypothetical protein
VFFDPSVPYGMQFEENEATGAPDRQLLGRERRPPVIARSSEGARDRTEKKPRNLRRVTGDKSSERPGERIEPPATIKRPEAAPAANDGKIVKLDTFRKK